MTAKSERTTKSGRLGLFHQAGDYLVAGLLLLSLSRSAVVAWPLALGTVALVNAAMTRGPLAAYKRIPLVTHRVIELGLVAACCSGALAVREHGLDSAALVSAAVLQGSIVWLSHVAGRAKKERRR